MGHTHVNWVTHTRTHTHHTYITHTHTHHTYIYIHHTHTHCSTHMYAHAYTHTHTPYIHTMRTHTHTHTPYTHTLTMHTHTHTHLQHELQRSLSPVYFLSRCTHLHSVCPHRSCHQNQMPSTAWSESLPFCQRPLSLVTEHCRTVTKT